MPSTSSNHGHVVPWRRLITLIVLIGALVASLLIGSLAGEKNRWLPEFALDLEGGTQIILTPTTTDGSTITESDVNQAIEIIRQRVDATGVAEAEITSQGGQNIVVGLPGTPSQETLQLVRTSAVLRFRPVLTSTYSGVITPSIVSQLQSSTGTSVEPVEGATEAATPSAEATPSASAEPSATPTATAEPTAGATATPAATDPTADSYTPEELLAEAQKLADSNGDGVISDEPSAEPTDASDLAWITEKAYYDSLILDCTDASSHNISNDDPAKPLVACDPETKAKYILGPAEVEGTSVTKATSGFDQQRNEWIVNLSFNDEGGEAFADVTSRISTLSAPRNQFGIVLDGQVISAPRTSIAITNHSATISGNFTSATAGTLANQLSFGSLPLNFEVQSEEQISATLGSDSLTSGLIAGAVGMLLVILYLLWQYHGLGLVAAGSVVLATAVSYLLVSLLSWTMGYRLSLAGVVGLIISIGITADSFIVFFERIRDEIRDGRTLKSAVAHGWIRARRTILVADGVNLLAAVVLYFLAVGSVRGFAFTFGLTTVIDIVIVMMFTYPIMTLLVRTKFFGGGHRLSGMDPEALGRTPSYRGRGVHGGKKSAEVAESNGVVVDTPSVLKADETSLTLAERRAATRRAAKETTQGNGEGDR